MKRFMIILGLDLITTLGFAGYSNAAMIDFTGGTITDLDGNTYITNNSLVVHDVDYYEEDGMHFDFLGPSGDPFSYIVGDYYDGNNDVIHGHWNTGDYGVMEGIRVDKIDGSAFDLNYFKLTTNTENGGAADSGNEQVYINALADGINVSYSMLLPTDDWGFAGLNQSIFLGAEFDNILAFTFTVGNSVDCFGLDEFYIDKEAPPGCPRTSNSSPTRHWLSRTCRCRGKT